VFPTVGLTARDAAPPRRAGGGLCEFAADRRVERRGPPVAGSFDAGGAPTQAANCLAKTAGCGGRLDRRRRTRVLGWRFAARSPAPATASPWADRRYSVAALPSQAHALGARTRNSSGRSEPSCCCSATPWCHRAARIDLRPNHMGHRFHAPARRFEVAKVLREPIAPGEGDRRFRQTADVIRAGVNRAGGRAGAPHDRDALLDE